MFHHLMITWHLDAGGFGNSMYLPREWLKIFGMLVNYRFLGRLAISLVGMARSLMATILTVCS